MDEIAAYERRFRHAGLPLLIEDYSAGADVFNRAVPLFVLVFWVEALGAVSLDFGWLANLAAVVGGLAILLAGLALANTLRGRRATAVPDHVGVVELALFVVVPGLLPLVFGVLVIVPPQIYLERLYYGQFTGSFLEWLPQAYDSGNLAWVPLWFVGYIFVLSFALLPVFLHLGHLITLHHPGSRRK